MNKRDARPGETTYGKTDEPEGSAKIAREALAAASSFAGDAAQKVKDAASGTAETLTGEVRAVLDRQVGSGAATLGSVARSVRRAAEDLQSDAPQIAGLVRTVASQVDGYAGALRSQSAKEIWESASDFTRKQPALVFGLAALAGFFMLRTVKSSPSVSSPPIQPSHNSGREGPSYGS